jgi:hypothetical protein
MNMFEGVKENGHGMAFPGVTPKVFQDCLGVISSWSTQSAITGGYTQPESIHNG